VRKVFGVNTNPKMTNPNRFLATIIRRRWVQVLVVLLVILVVWFLSSVIWSGSRTNQQDIPLFVVQRGPLTISVTESGTIKSRDQVVVKSQVEGRTTILTLIPEGTYVKKGDLLVELDSSSLEDQKTRQQITVLNNEAAYIRASENLAVTKSQGESDIAKAELDDKFAKLDRKKYLDDTGDVPEGEYPQQVKQLKADITIAEQELTQAQEKLDWSEKLAKAKYITASELKTDELDANRKQINLELAKGKLDLLQDYTHLRDQEQKDSDVVQAEMALERVNRRAKADNIQAEADLKAKESEFKRQQTILDKNIEQIAKCKIIAPVDGMVVYATTGQGGFRGNVEPLDEGQEVRERQELIHLPTTSSMMAEVKVHESSLRKVRSGMPVVITVDALPGKVFSARVGKIGLLPDATMAWLNPDLKVYSTEIYLDGDASEIRPGMSCRAEIIVEEYSDTVYVPVQSILRVGDIPTAYVVGPHGPESRQVELGLDNNRMVRIVSGLKEGEKIMLAPPLSPSTVVAKTEPRREEAKEPAAGSQQKPPTAPGTAEVVASQATAQDQSTKSSEFDPEKLRNLSPEEGKKLFESLSPEQREKLMKLARQQRGRSQGESTAPAPKTNDSGN